MLEKRLPTDILARLHVESATCERIYKKAHLSRVASKPDLARMGQMEGVGFGT